MTHVTQYIDKLIISQKLLAMHKGTWRWKWRPDYSHNLTDDIKCNSRYHKWYCLGINMHAHKFYIIFSFRFVIQHQITWPDHEEVSRGTNNNLELMTVWELQYSAFVTLSCYHPWQQNACHSLGRYPNCFWSPRHYGDWLQFNATITWLEFETCCDQLDQWRGIFLPFTINF